MRFDAREAERAVKVGSISIVPVARTLIVGEGRPSGFVLQASKVPVCILVDTGRERYALDLEGGRRPVDGEPGPEPA